MIISEKKLNRIVEERLMREYEHDRINKLQDTVRGLENRLETVDIQIKLLYGRLDNPIITRTEPYTSWDGPKPPYIATCNTKKEGGD